MLCLLSFSAVEAVLAIILLAKCEYVALFEHQEHGISGTYGYALGFVFCSPPLLVRIHLWTPRYPTDRGLRPVQAS